MREVPFLQWFGANMSRRVVVDEYFAGGGLKSNFFWIWQGEEDDCRRGISRGCFAKGDMNRMSFTVLWGEYVGKGSCRWVFRWGGGVLKSNFCWG